MRGPPFSAPDRRPFSDALERALGWTLVVLMSVMVMDVSWQVPARFLLKTSSSFSEELAGFLLIWIGLLGAAYGIRTRAHLGIDLLVARLGGKGRKVAEAASHLLVIGFAMTTMVAGGLKLVHLAFQLNQISAAMGIRMGFVYLALPLSGILISLFAAESLWAALSRSGSGEGAGT